MAEPGDDAPAESASWSELFVGRLGVYTLVLSLGMILFAINQFVVATILPTVVAELGGVGYYTWAFSLFAVGAIIGAASAGSFRDAFGTQPAYAGAGLILGVGLAGAALATDMPTLVGFRLIQGIGGGALASQAYGLIAVIYPQHLRSRVLSLVSTIWGVATVGGPGFGGAFAEYGVWRGAFWTLVPFTVVFAVLAWRYIEGTKGHGRLSEIPYWRLALLAVAVLGMSATSLTDASWLRAVLVVASIAVAALAFACDARAERNMFPRQITKMTTELGALYWILFLVSIVLTFVNIYTTFYLQVLHGVTPFAAGYLFAIQSLMWTGSALLVAMLRSSLETASIVAGLVLVLIASVAIALTAVDGPVVAIGGAIGLSGLGIGLLNNPTIQRIIAVAPDEEKHVAGTSVQTIRNIAISFGAAAAGMVASSAGLSDGADRDTVAHAIRWVYGANVIFAALAVLMVAPLIIAHRAGRRRNAG